MTSTFLNNLVDKVDGFLGTYILVPALLITGLYFTISLGFPQIMKFGKAFKITFGGMFKKDDSKGSLSSFQALATAVAAQIGTGNIGGVATAIATGGPGAVFWMWFSAIFGMSTIFGEAVLAQIYRERRNGELVGGPAYYIANGMGPKLPKLAKFLSGFFAVAIVFALGIVGNMVQSNSIASGIHASIPAIPVWIVGVVLAVVGAFIFIGGVQRIGKFAEIVVPFMAIIYLVASIVVLVKFGSYIPSVFKMIFTAAFSADAIIGGVAGVAIKKAIQLGFQRGLFSNEAGMGSTPNAHAVAIVDHPAEQGLTAMVGVFIDTFMVCTATALLILSTGANTLKDASGHFYNSVPLTQQAFIKAFGQFGGYFLAICLTFFAFTTIVGWYYFGETNIKFLFGKKGLMPYRILVLIGIVVGSTLEIELVWKLSGLANNLMVIPNVIALLYLSKQVKEIYKDYNHCLKTGDIHYDYPEAARPYPETPEK